MAFIPQSEDQFIDSALTIWVRSPLVPYYACRIFYKQDLGGASNSMDMGFVVHDADLYNNVSIRCFRSMI